MRFFLPSKTKDNNSLKISYLIRKVFKEERYYMHMKTEILVESAKEYYEMGNIAYKRKSANSAVILYFKTLVALVDLYILQQTNQTPSSHTQRFRITKEKFSQIYNILDKNFPFYQDSYTQKMSLELAEVIKDDIAILTTKTNTEL